MMLSNFTALLLLFSSSFDTAQDDGRLDVSRLDCMTIYNVAIFLLISKVHMGAMKA
jgi:hypothetical protein